MPPARTPAPQLGLIVLQTDETVEDEARFYLHNAPVRLLCTRIPVSDEINAATLRAMRAHLSGALELFPHGKAFDVMGYACTSAATVIGEDAVHQDIAAAVRTRHTTNPLTAAKAALAHIGARRIAYVSPYVAEVAQAMQDAFTQAGFAITHSHNFNLNRDSAVAALPPQEILAAVTALPVQECDAVFISCTNLRCAEILPLAEHALGKPVLSSNQALLWHMRQLAKVPPPSAQQAGAYGQLFTLPDAPL